MVVAQECSCVFYTGAAAAAAALEADSFVSMSLWGSCFDGEERKKAAVGGEWPVVVVSSDSLDFSVCSLAVFLLRSSSGTTQALRNRIKKERIR